MLVPHAMRNRKLISFTTLSLLISLSAVISAAPGRWRTATSEELKKLLPARAPVVKENIETEFRTASGVTNGKR